MAGPAITVLDTLLYAWLAEPEERRFKLAFNSYYQVAYPAIVRYLAKRSAFDASDLEEFANDTLLKFFQKLGGRRDASIRIKRALTQIEPINLGPFHARSVPVWTKDVSLFWDAVMGFRLTPIPGATDWKTSIVDLTARIKPLQKRGCCLIDEVRSRVSDVSIASASEDLSSQIAVTMEFAHMLSKEVDARTERWAAIEDRYPGIATFVGRTSMIIATLPDLSIPTNGLLFTIAANAHADRCKASTAKKRGGKGREESAQTGVPLLKDERSGDDSTNELPHPLLNPKIDDLGSAMEGEESVDHWLPGRLDEPVDDPAQQYENEQFLVEFLNFLRRPVAEAEDAHEKAATNGRAAAERKKLDSVTRKFDRVISVLDLLGEGHTQDAIAQKLDLSRNQVKYVVELVQEAYERLAAASGSTQLRVWSAGDHYNV